ncbi:hypothetical protein [Methylorubrum sp. SB2]|uniref:hypothetical protein n=1 Tax=Methylorubrum subtropicum TaxID=3138812 RepID=UPI00313CD43B
MPVLLANADPAFPFVDCVRRQACDLFPAPPAAKSFVIDFAGGGRVEGATPEQLDDALIEREVWGFWPPVRGGNAILIRDDLSDFATLAANAPDDSSWALILIDAAALTRFGSDGAAGVLTRDILTGLSAKKRGGTPGRTIRMSTVTTRNLYMRRILVVMSGLEGTGPAVEAAHALVREDLVDNVVFLAARDPSDPQRHAIYFAGLRLLESLAAVKDIEKRFEDPGGRQKFAGVVRLTIDRALLSAPTLAHRRLSIVQRMIEHLKQIEQSGERRESVRQVADEIREIRDTIESRHKAMGRSAWTNPGPERMPEVLKPHLFHVKGGRRRTLAHAEANVARLDEAARRQINRSAVIADPVEPGSDDEAVRESPSAARMQLTKEAGDDEEIARKIRDIQSGLFRNLDPGERDLVQHGRQLDEIIAKHVARQRWHRAAMADEADGARFVFLPAEARVEALARPAPLALGGDRTGRSFVAPVARELADYAHAARLAGEAEGGLLRWGGLILVLAAIVTAQLVPASRATSVTVWHLWEAVTFQDFTWGLFIYAFIATTFVAAPLMAFCCAKNAHQRAVTRMARSLGAEADSATQPSLLSRLGRMFEDAHRFRGTHLTLGRLTLLRRRVKELGDTLQKLERVQLIQDRIAAWPAPKDLPGTDPLPGLRTKLDQELARVPRERWITHLLRVEDHDAPLAVALYTFDNETPAREFRSTVFLAGRDEGETITLERLEREAAPDASGTVA